MFSAGEFYYTCTDFGSPGCGSEDNAFRGDNEDTDFWKAISCSDVASR